MRLAFVETLLEAIKKDKNIILITGDLGYGVLTEIWEKYPQQFINAGISEQNMAAVACGMALEGKIVFIYSIANFPTFRCLEQIRNDILYHKANVKIVALGAGFSYGTAGMSHHATEDIAIMGSLPNLTVFSPCDQTETKAVTKASIELNSPCYIRLGKGGEPQIHSNDISFQVGRAIEIISGNKICIIATGSIIIEALEAAKSLNKMGISTALLSMPTINPIDDKAIQKFGQIADVIVTVEEHNINGGLGSLVANILASISGKTALLKKVGIHGGFSSVVGSQEFLREYNQIKARDIVNLIVG